jgi:hypothetical protein
LIRLFVVRELKKIASLLGILEMDKKDILSTSFLLSMLTYSMGNINGTLPFYTIDFWIITMSLIVISQSTLHFYLGKDVLLISFYIFFVTFLVNGNLVDVSIIKNYLRFILLSTIFYTLFKWHDFDFISIIKQYLRFAFIFCIFGYLQILGFLLNINFLYDFSFLGIKSPEISFGILRVSSLATEPAWLIQSLFPALILSIGTLFFNDSLAMTFLSKKRSMFYLGIGLLSQSTLFFLCIPLIILFYLLKNFSFKGGPKIIFTITISCVFLIFLYYQSIHFRDRIDSLYKLGNIYNKSDNLSVFALQSNLLVSIKSLEKNPFWGTGIDTYRINYDNYIGKIFNRRDIYMELNSNDGGSIYFRLISEIGLLGFLLIFILFFRKFRTLKDKNKGYTYLFLMSLILFGLRNGQYINPFFHLYFWGALLLKNSSENHLSYEDSKFLNAK